MFGKIVFFIIMLVIGLAILKYTEPVVRTFGKNSLAEKHLGYGGTYSMWKIIAVIGIIVGFLYLTGVIEFGGWNKLNLENTEIDTTIEK